MLAPQVRVLTSDLLWVSLGELSTSNQLIGFDENGPYRRWRVTSVHQVELTTLPCYELVFDDGTRVVCSTEHRWLTAHGGGTNWIVTGRMRVGRRCSSRVVKPVDVWTPDRSWEAGFLAAGFDGEGHIHQKDLEAAGVNGVAHVVLGFSQKENPMKVEMQRCLAALGYEVNIGKDKKSGVGLMYIRHRPNILRFLGSIRPPRLLSKFNPEVLGLMGVHEARRPRLIRREHVGEQQVVLLKTDRRTLCVEGFASHAH